MMKKHVILVVEDEEEIRALFVRFLGMKGFDVESAGTLAKGRKILKDVTPSLIFLDVNLPDGNGLEELYQLEKAHLSDKVIMMSAFVSQEDRDKARSLGAIDFFSKPFSLYKLEQAVNSQIIKTKNQESHGENSRNRR